MPTTLADALDLLNRGGTLLLLLVLAVAFLQGKVVSGDAHKRELSDRDAQIKQLNDRLDSAYIARDRAMDLAVFGANMTKDSLNLAHNVIRGTGVDGGNGPENIPT